jgi:HPt (histidine-containing phosphotransfer) domain-containing protein
VTEQLVEQQMTSSQSRSRPVAEVFDQAHLARYTMNSIELEREIIGLFLVQLPATVDMIEEAETAAEWKLATHTLKGAAAAVGAKRLEAIAIELESIKVDSDVNVKLLLLESLGNAVVEFRDAMRHVYP